MGSCWSQRKDYIIKEECTRSHDHRKRHNSSHLRDSGSSIPISIRSSKSSFSTQPIDTNSQYEFGKTPTDQLEHEQEVFRKIVSRAEKDFIDIGSSSFQSWIDITKLDMHKFGENLNGIPILESYSSVFDLPLPSVVNNIQNPLLDSELFKVEFNMMHECSESISKLFRNIEVTADNIEVIVPFPLIAEEPMLIKC